MVEKLTTEQTDVNDATSIGMYLNTYRVMYCAPFDQKGGCIRAGMA